MRNITDLVSTYDSNLGAPLQYKGSYEDKGGNSYQPLSTYSSSGSPYWKPEPAGGAALRCAYKSVYRFIEHKLDTATTATTVGDILKTASTAAGKGKTPKSAREFYNMLRKSGQLACLAECDDGAGGAGVKRKRSSVDRSARDGTADVATPLTVTQTAGDDDPEARV